MSSQDTATLRYISGLVSTHGFEVSVFTGNVRRGTCGGDDARRRVRMA